MTIEQFDKTGFYNGLEVIYQGKTFAVGSVDFEERLIGIIEFPEEEGYSWKRCENCELVEPK